LSARPVRLGILISGRGSNFLAIADAIANGKLHGAEIAVVVSSTASAPGLAAARAKGFPAFAVEPRNRSREEQDTEIMVRLRAYDVGLVCLAGYMRLLSSPFVAAYPERILNIHPSLLPSFPGLDAQAQAIAYGVQLSGCTVHFVDEQLDHGVIVMQRAVPVLPEDDAQKLADRILVAEHELYPEAIKRVISGAYKIEGRRYVHSAQPTRQSTMQLMRTWLKSVGG
jgi:phosphoribosylglycinamide formyltransferase-1